MTDRVLQKKQGYKSDRFNIGSYGSKRSSMGDSMGKSNADTSSMGAFSIVKAIGFGFITAMALLLLLSLLAVFYDIPDSVLNGTIVAVSILSLFIVGFKTAHYNRKKGLLMGVISGLVYGIILYGLAFMIWKSVAFSLESIINIAAGSAISGLGGFVGINRLANSRRKKR